MNIIADIAGRYETFLELLKKMPDEEVLAVGDLIDRGPQSRQVVEWFMSHGKALMGNHEHLLIDARKNTAIYPSGTWLSNGAWPTLISFNMDVPDCVVDWMETLPLYYEEDGLFVSHAFLHQRKTLEEACNIWNCGLANIDYTIIWNRDPPIRRDKFQVAGHNAYMGLRKFEDEQGDFAICIDASNDHKLTGLHWPSMKVYQQPYLEEAE